jgi:hypothetical protein
MRAHAVNDAPEPRPDANLDESDAVVSERPRDAEKVVTRGHELSRLAQEPMAGGGQHDAGARSLEERHPDFPLQLANMSTQWRLGDMQSLRGACEMQLVGHGNKGAQVPEIHAG